MSLLSPAIGRRKISVGPSLSDNNTHFVTQIERENFRFFYQSERRIS